MKSMHALLSIPFIQRSLFLVPVVGILTLTTAQTGLTKEPHDPVHDVQWYKTHEAERKSMLAKCHNNPGQLANTPNCINAETASKQIMTSHEKPSSFGTMPPMTKEDLFKGQSK
jgi:hypothetical protein